MGGRIETEANKREPLGPFMDLYIQNILYVKGKLNERLAQRY